jgi:hypothetical protein
MFLELTQDKQNEWVANRAPKSPNRFKIVSMYINSSRFTVWNAKLIQTDSD